MPDRVACHCPFSIGTIVAVCPGTGTRASDCTLTMGNPAACAPAGASKIRVAYTSPESTCARLIPPTPSSLEPGPGPGAAPARVDDEVRADQPALLVGGCRPVPR
ncbi:hypothetical protein GCM10020254_20650 [Streptomyces goshikiensis]